MTLHPDVEELLNAWEAFDKAAAKLGKLAAEAIARGRIPPPPSANTLHHERRRLAAAEQALHLPHNWTRGIAQLRWHPNGSPHMEPRSAVLTLLGRLLPDARIDHLPASAPHHRHKEAS